MPRSFDSDLFEGFATDETTPYAPSPQHELERALGETAELHDATRLLKPAGLARLPGPGISFFRRHRAWFVQTDAPDARAATALGAFLRGQLVGKRSLVAADLWLHDLTLYVGHRGGYVELAVEAPSRVAPGPNLNAHRARILALAKATFGASGAALSGHDGDYRLAIRPALQSLKGVFSSGSLSAPTLPELEAKLVATIAELEGRLATRATARVAPPPTRPPPATADSARARLLRELAELESQVKAARGGPRRNPARSAAFASLRRRLDAAATIAEVERISRELGATGLTPAEYDLLLDEANDKERELWSHATRAPGRRNPGPRPSRYPTSVQRCVVHVSTRDAALDGRAKPDGRDVGRAFAICVSGAQKAGGMVPGTRQLTPQGALRQTRYTPQERREGTRAYEATLRGAKGPRGNPWRDEHHWSTRPIGEGDLVEILPPVSDDPAHRWDVWTHNVGRVVQILGSKASGYEVRVRVPRHGDVWVSRRRVRQSQG